MVKKSNVSKAEIRRRTEQSQKDKKASSSVPRTITTGRKSAKKNTRSSGGPDYASLVLDPCNASFAQSNMPGASGAQAVRLPFRRILTVPSTSQDIRGGAIANNAGTPMNTLIGVLTPHAMNSVAGPVTLAFRGAGSEVEQLNTAGIVNSAFYDYADAAGLQALSSFVGEMRPIAACIRITCLASDSANQGLFFGYEGAAKNFVTHVDGDFTKGFTPQGCAQDLIFNGQTTGDTYKTYEVRINYPNASPQWQDWRAIGTPLTPAGVIESGDAGDAIFSEMPIGIVGVTSAAQGTKYLFDGAIVYEWQPKTIAGLVGPKKVPASPTALANVARTVQSVANKLGGMLISVATDYATGGSATNALALLRQGYAAYTASKARQPMLLGWHN